MNNFYKKCAVIYDLEGNPMFVCDVLDFTSEDDYKKLKEKANSNFQNYVKMKAKEDKNFKAEINKSIYDLAMAVKKYTSK